MPNPSSIKLYFEAERSRNPQKAHSDFLKLLRYAVHQRSEAGAFFKLAEQYRNGVFLADDPDSAAARLYYEAAQLGHVSAQYLLANALMEARGVKKDLNQAVYWYREAAEKKHTKARAKLDELAAQGVDITKPYKVLTESSTQSFDNLSADSEASSSEQKQSKGKEPAKEQQEQWGNIDEVKLTQLVEEEAQENSKQNIAEEFFKQAEDYRKGLYAPQDNTMAARYYYEAAKLGHAKAQFQFAEALIDGRGVNANRKKAKTWYRKAAMQGHIKAQLYLAILFEIEGKFKNNVACWFWRAAQQGNAEAQYNLGKMYAEGNGINKNDEKAFFWYQTSANQNYAPSQYEVGSAYETGCGIQQDYAQAAHWFNLAAAQNHKPALINLSFAYFHGRGVARDIVQARECFNRVVRSEEALPQNRLALFKARLEFSSSHSSSPVNGRMGLFTAHAMNTTDLESRVVNDASSHHKHLR